MTDHKATDKSLKLFVIAGEHSGDMHAANMVRAIQRLHPRTRVLAIGGPELEEAGARVIQNIVKDLAIIGVFAVIPKLPKILRLFRTTREAIQKFRPDALILVDYPGFNIRMAEWAHREGIRVIWYISPQVWAWKRGRLAKLKRVVDKMMVVFPFEVSLYKEEDVDVEHVGHPLFDVIHVRRSREEICSQFGLDPARPFITIVPGSRKKEVKAFLPILLAGAQRYREMDPSAQFAIIVAPTIPRSRIDRIIRDAALDFEPFVIEGSQEDRFAMRGWSDFSWVKSGTSTLEAAILGSPMLIVYRVNFMTWFVGKQIFTIGHVGLPNIVAGDRIVPELLQDEFTPRHLAEKTRHYLGNPEEYARMKQDLAEVRQKLGEQGAADNAARVVIEACGLEPSEAAAHDASASVPESPVRP